ncbi:azurin [bacterium]|nr:azurin [bacterium]
MKIFIPVLLAAILSPLAQAKACKLSLSGTDQMQYSTKELKVAKDCDEISVTLKHAGKLAKNIMGHNFVLVKTADVSGVSGEALKVGAEKDYIPKDARILAHTKLLAGGQSDTVKFKKTILTAGGDYTYFCTFPGHVGLMQGKFIVE